MDYAHAHLCEQLLINKNMKAIQIISQDLFDKVRSRFQNLEMGDETGAVTIDPAEARFFDFDFVIEGNDLGRVSISLNDLGSLKVYYSQGITENQDDPVKKYWYSFLKEMRFFAMRRLLRFDTRDIAKTKLDKNDFQHLATTQAPKEEEMNNMNESRWNDKSTKKTSRAVQGRTEVIVRHAKAVDEEYAGSRSQRKNIKAIFIQNADGERFKYPFIHPAGAFAMAQHVDHGGIPHDPAGKAIINMSEEIAQLGEFQRKIHRATLHDDATGITERAIGRLQELKAMVGALGKRHHYESWASNFNEQEILDDSSEMDAVAMEQYKQAFTQTSFQEELTGYFPLLHRIMKEANKVNLEDYVNESDNDADEYWHDSNGRPDPHGAYDAAGHYHPDRNTDESADKKELPWDDKEDKSNFKKPNNPNRTPRDTAKALAQKGLAKAKSPAESIDAFEEWADATEQGKLTDDQIDTLKQALGELPQGANGPELELGPDGQTAWQFFNQLGIEDSDLESKLQDMANVDPETDALEVFKLWADDSYPELSVALGMSGTGEEPAPAPEEQPVAENGYENQPADPEMVRAMAEFLKNCIESVEIGKQEPDSDPEDIRYTTDLPAMQMNLKKLMSGHATEKDLHNALMGYDTEWRETLEEWFREENPELYNYITGGDEYTSETEAGTDPTNTKGEHGKGYGDASRGVDKNPFNPGSLSHGAYRQGQQDYKRSFGENEEMSAPKGAMSKGGVVQEVAKIVKSFYNRDNPDVGPFRGGEGIALDVKKQIAEKFGDEAGEQAAQMAEQFIDKLTKEWEQKHGHVANGHGDDGLARLKELLGNIKGKVESISDVGGHPGKNIMSAEDDQQKSPEKNTDVSDTKAKMDRLKDTKSGPFHNVGKGLKAFVQGKPEPMGENSEVATILRLSGLAK